VIQEAELFDKNIVTLRCEHCGQPLTERSKSGGRQKRFCNEHCRTKFHNSQRVKRVSETVAHKSETFHETVAHNDTKPDTKPPEDDNFDWLACEFVVHQPKRPIAIYFNNDGDLVIRQPSWPDDAAIIIEPDHIWPFLDAVTDACGVPSAGRP